MTRPSLADITQRAGLREHLKAAGAPALLAEKNAAGAADATVLLAAIRDVLAVAAEYEGDNILSAAPVVREIRRAITAHIDTTPQEAS